MVVSFGQLVPRFGLNQSCHATDAFRFGMLQPKQRELQALPVLQAIGGLSISIEAGSV
jgi:hypothetical protein